MILHFCSHAEWDAAQAAGAYVADSLTIEGFIHCSTVDTVLLPANAIARGRTDLVLLEIDESGLPVRYESGDPADPQATLFPHVYAPIPAVAVTGVHEFPCQPDGTFALPTALSTAR
jgi:uncharacterized protein (DUF952 family)